MITRLGRVTYVLPKQSAPTVEERKSCVCLDYYSGPPGDRTRDTVIKSHVLYH